MANENQGNIKTVVKIFVGLLLLVAVAYAMTWPSWFWAVVKLLQGGIALLVFFIGLGLVLMGVSEFKD